MVASSSMLSGGSEAVRWYSLMPATSQWPYPPSCANRWRTRRPSGVHSCPIPGQTTVASGSAALMISRARRVISTSFSTLPA